MPRSPLFFAFIGLLILSACQPAPSSSSAPPAGSSGQATAAATATAPAPSWALRAQSRWLRDAEGRVVLLNGVNASQTAKQAPYLTWHQEQDFARLRAQGFNFVRLLISWKAVEPSPGHYDDAYLDAVRHRLDWCQEQGLFVLVDMHQDAYAEDLGGNGAPDWAVLDGQWPQINLPGSLPWQAVYAQPRVIAAFDAFWNNKPIPATGRGVQDHFVAAWQHVAQRFQDHPAVLGYDILNEPFYGLEIFSVLREFLLQMPGVVLPALFNGGNWQASVLSSLSQNGPLYRVLDGMEPSVGDFERRRLQPFMTRAARAIRQIDAEKLIFVEPSILVGIGIRSSLTPLRDSSGARLDGIVYAPHFYDPIAEALPYDGNHLRAEEAFRRIVETGRRLDMPVVIGEWGFLRQSLQGHMELARDQLRELDRHLLGHAYWSHNRTTEAEPYWPLLVRPRPLRIAGTPSALNFDPASRTLTLQFQETGASGPTLIALPPSVYPTGFHLSSSDPLGQWSWRLSNDGLRLEIRSDPQQPSHTLTLAPQ